MFPRAPNRLKPAPSRRKRSSGIRFRAEPYPVDTALELERATGLSRPVATVLTRRGFGDPDAAARFLGAGESHDPFGFEGMAEVVARVRAAIM